MNFLYNYADLYTEIHIGETITGLTGLEWLCDVRWDHVLSFVIFPICGHIQMVNI